MPASSVTAPSSPGSHESTSPEQPISPKPLAPPPVKTAKSQTTGIPSQSQTRTQPETATVSPAPKLIAPPSSTKKSVPNH